MCLHLAGLGVVMAALGCDSSKSGNPTSPGIGGPIAGVTISAPEPVAPSGGATVVADGRDVVLIVANATTNGVRPLSYTFDVGTDATFGTLAFSRAGVAPGENGRTSVAVSGLEVGRTYHWRARALDGANTGPYSEPRQFATVPPLTIAAPVPLDPTDMVRVTTRQPTLRTRNATRTGQAGPITYEFHVATSSGFASLAASVEQAEQTSQTQVTLGNLLDPNTTYYWRVRAKEATVTSVWSATQAFLTPLPTPTPPPPQGTGVPSAAEGEAMIAFVIADLKQRGISTDGDCGAFEITKRVAWAFRDRGAGLERKTAGRRCEDASIDIVLFNEGTSVDILIGAGVDNGPAWQAHPPYDGWQHYWVAPYNPDGLT